MGCRDSLPRPANSRMYRRECRRVKPPWLLPQDRALQCRLKFLARFLEDHPRVLGRHTRRLASSRANPACDHPQASKEGSCLPGPLAERIQLGNHRGWRTNLALFHLLTSVSNLDLALHQMVSQERPSQRRRNRAPSPSCCLGANRPAQQRQPRSPRRRRLPSHRSWAHSSAEPNNPTHKPRHRFLLADLPRARLRKQDCHSAQHSKLKHSSSSSSRQDCVLAWCLQCSSLNKAAVVLSQ